MITATKDSCSLYDELLPNIATLADAMMKKKLRYGLVTLSDVPAGDAYKILNRLGLKVIGSYGELPGFDRSLPDSFTKYRKIMRSRNPPRNKNKVHKNDYTEVHNPKVLWTHVKSHAEAATDNELLGKALLYLPPDYDGSMPKQNGSKIFTFTREDLFSGGNIKKIIEFVYS